jgi:hypothetical protein
VHRHPLQPCVYTDASAVGVLMFLVTPLLLLLLIRLVVGGTPNTSMPGVWGALQHPQCTTRQLGVPCLWGAAASGPGGTAHTAVVSRSRGAGLTAACVYSVCVWGGPTYTLSGGAQPHMGC